MVALAKRMMGSIWPVRRGAGLVVLALLLAGAVAWAELRKSSVAPWIGLTLPRVLARLPYGAGTERIDRFAFEEVPADRPHTAYLWTGAGWAVARWMAGVFIESGWKLAGSASLRYR